MVGIQKSCSVVSIHRSSMENWAEGGASVTFLHSILSLCIELAVKDSQLLLGMERYAMQVECTFVILDNFVYSPCNNKILGTSLLSLLSGLFIRAVICSLFTHSTNIF